MNSKLMLSEESKMLVIAELNKRIGPDITDLPCVHIVENEYIAEKNELEKSLNEASSAVPSNFHAAMNQVEENCSTIKDLQQRCIKIQDKVNKFSKTSTFFKEKFHDKLSEICKLEATVVHLQWWQSVSDISQKLKNCDDREQAIELYTQLKDLYSTNKIQSQRNFLKDNIIYWRHTLAGILEKEYEEVFKGLKWPFTNTKLANAVPPGDVLERFTNLTRLLFRIEPPPGLLDDYKIADRQCLPVKFLFKPLRKRFAFHFGGTTRLTARLDKPEWFFTQTLTWIRDHSPFIRNNVQVIANKLHIDVDTEKEFVDELVSLATERLHFVLTSLDVSSEENPDTDELFAHTVDELLGFQRELATLIGNDSVAVLSVLTKAEIFVKWIAIEEKYYLLRLDDILSDNSWIETINTDLDTGDMNWVPMGCNTFISMLETLQDRYSILPQPGHRLQFLELQLQLVEEWRVRLTQLLGSTGPGERHIAAAVLNAAHHTRAVLLLWAHSLHYLQLHFYRKQFQHFTELQHRNEDVKVDAVKKSEPEESEIAKDCKKLSLVEVETKAKELAENEVIRRDSLATVLEQYGMMQALADTNTSLLTSPDGDTDPEEDSEEAGVFGQLPALLARLRDGGLHAMAQHILLEFKAGLREYKRQKWHSLPIVEEGMLCVSGALCEPLAGLCQRLHSVEALLAPPLFAQLRTHLAASIDSYLFEEVVLENWWSSGGVAQLVFDVKRNLLPVFAPRSQLALHHLPKLTEACALLTLDYDAASKLSMKLLKQAIRPQELLSEEGYRHILANEVLQLFNQRTDLNENRTSHGPQSVMDLF